LSVLHPAAPENQRGRVRSFSAAIPMGADTVSRSATRSGRAAPRLTSSHAADIGTGIFADHVTHGGLVEERFGDQATETSLRSAPRSSATPARCTRWPPCPAPTGPALIVSGGTGESMLV